MRGEAHIEPTVTGVHIQHDEVKAESDLSNETMIEGVGAGSDDGSTDGKDSETEVEAEIVVVDSPADQIPSCNQSSTLEVCRKDFFFIYLFFFTLNDSNSSALRCYNPP